MLIKRKAQSTLEYALIVAVVVGGLIAMQVYVKRGLQGKIKASADDIGEQYSPGNTTGSVNVTVSTNTTEKLASGVTTTQSSTTQNRSGSESVASFDQEYWGE